MRWLWFVGTLGCLAIAFRTHSMGLAALCLIGALVTLLAGTLALASRRIDSRSQNTSAMLDPVAMRHMRESIERRKRDTEGGVATTAAVGGAATQRDPDTDVDSVSLGGGDGGNSSD
ncbi:MAG: hypothetical protein LKM32_00690 [Chiayiivirga sp.]|jgi:hypothetical protein|uniref:hypothetical protein n=1 Tax=Chiayiivirga sp. TaxID=2041042 RepID=UPI0025BED665|nr:hypothetical protein [Chiayiivirga sp.]MCI1711247.1 hypothetical protein [Chiayiivirga sp.]MCI1727952.1 hypothetical protein [Chiayiivirga sp.]